MAAASIPISDQIDLCRRAQVGDRAARDRLVVGSMGLVHWIAKRYIKSAPGLELDDLASEGVLGLLIAIEKFDPDRGFAFTTYAKTWVEQRIRAANAADRGLKPSDTGRSVFRRDVLALVKDGQSRETAIETVAAKTRAKVETVRGIVEAFERKRPRSLDAPLRSDSDGTFADVLAADTIDLDLAIDSAIRDVKVRQLVDRFSAKLTARDRAILDRRILRSDGDESTLGEIGRDFSVSRERIRQLEVVLRQKLRDVLTIVQDKPERRHCRICGLPIRKHNRYGICHAHGRSRTFDRETGRCSVCSEVVTDPSRRGSHALLHTIDVMTEEEVKRNQREAHSLLRTDRRSRGVCLVCGGEKIDGSHCGKCRKKNNDRGTAWRRRLGRQERQLVLITHLDRTQSIAAWARETGIPLKILWQRAVKSQWPTDRVFEPLGAGHERQREKPFCVRGHPRTPENLWQDRKSRRHCRPCGRERCRIRRAGSPVTDLPDP